MDGSRLIMKNMNILIAGGGTGGHLFPALAIGEEILSRNSNIISHSLCGIRVYYTNNHPINSLICFSLIEVNKQLKAPYQ